MSNSREGDTATILRHLVETTQWGGNQGAKSETMEALDRLTSDAYGNDDAQVDEPADDATEKESGVKNPFSGTRPATQRSGATGRK